jgi:CRISPR-associated protein Cmr6
MKVKEIKDLLSQVDNPALLFNKLLVLKYTEQISRGQDVRKLEYIGFFTEILKGKKPQKPPELEGVKQDSFRLKTAYRLVIGAGYPSFIENGFLFHHVYGIPYVPGETLKGLARAVFILSVVEAMKGKFDPSKIEEGLLEEAEEEISEEAKGILHQIPDRINIILDNYTIENPVETFRKIFGSKKRRGQVIFFDAYPVKFNPSEHFEADIMNPHYGKYYQSQSEKEVPADWLSPTPIHFLALKEGIDFEFSLGLASLEPMEGNEERLLLEITKRLLKVGLENFGVGNKKRKGYGWFK